MNSDVDVHPWDAAHAAAAASAATNQDPEAYAEPNFQFAIPDDVLASASTAAAPCESIRGQRLCMWPPGQNVMPYDWHLDASGLRAARAEVMAALPNPAPWYVRIGHLDTGYSDTHETRPRNLLPALGRNVMDGAADPASAIDPATTHALLSQPGHGTSTLAILAGGQCTKLGGADIGAVPFAEVVPVRMSDYVWHVWTAAIPRAMDWAVQQGCHVLTLSHGGLASQTWADSVNAAYDAGCIVVAATGDCFHGLPLRDVVWPARFRRVIAVSGVTFDGTPYYNEAFGIGVMEGNYGPDAAMNYAIAAYTPNVLWARCKDDSGNDTPDGYDLDGGGTSAATPQVSGAVALYLQKYHVELQAIADPIQRIETVRAALFQSAKPGAAGHLYFGAGLLDAAAMLALAPGAVQALPNLDADEIRFELLSHLPGWSALTPGQQNMLEVEANQIATQHPFIATTIYGWEAHSGMPQGEELLRFLKTFRDLTNPSPSRLLYHLIDDAMHA